MNILTTILHTRSLTLIFISHFFSFSFSLCLCRCPSLVHFIYPSTHVKQFIKLVFCHTCLIKQPSNLLFNTNIWKYKKYVLTLLNAYKINLLFKPFTNCLNKTWIELCTKPMHCITNLATNQDIILILIKWQIRTIVIWFMLDFVFSDWLM